MPRIALFPLRTVLVPGLVLPLHIFEPRYRLLVRLLAEEAADERGFGVVAISPGSDPDAPGGCYQVGTFAKLLEATPLEDGGYDLITVGATRFRVDTLDHAMPFLRAHVHLLPEPLGAPSELPELAELAGRLLLAYRRRIAEWGVIEMPEIADMPTDPTALSYLINAAVVMDITRRQQMLVAATTAERLRAQCAFLRSELQVMAALPSLPAVDLVTTPPPPN